MCRRKQLAEKKSYVWLKRAIPGFWHRVENLIGVGMPDAYYEKDGAAVWVENKEGVFVRDKKTKDVILRLKKKVTPQQMAWHKKHQTVANGMVFIAVWSEQLKRVLLFHSDSAEKLNQGVRVENLSTIVLYNRSIPSRSLIYISPSGIQSYSYAAAIMQELRNV
jgi:hypothetical protein